MTISVWNVFDALVSQALRSNPWRPEGAHLAYEPDLDLLTTLLAVPLRFRAPPQSGLPAKAIDVWVAHELRRAGFEPDEVWPRATDPRVLPREIALLLARLPVTQRREIETGSRQGWPGSGAMTPGSSARTIRSRSTSSSRSGSAAPSC